MLNILVDMDNTICDFTTKYIYRWNNMYRHKINIYNHYETVVDNCDIFYNNFYVDLVPYTNAISSIVKLDKIKGCNVILCTHAENTNAIHDKKEWIKKYLGENWISKLVCVDTSDKTIIDGNIMIDDNPNSTIGVKTPTWSTKIIYYNQPYNQHVQKNSIIPHFTWNNIDKLISYIRDMSR